MGTTPVCTIDGTGLHRPSLGDCLAYFVAQYQSIYGSDIYVEPDSQDGQWLGILAAAVDDANGECEAAYNSFSPSTAQGTGLSSVVKINNIQRLVPSYSTCDVTLVGVVGTTITNGIVIDASGNQWTLPSPVVIPSAGQIDVTATCAVLGAIAAAPGTINQIFTQFRGFQSVTNAASATPGAPVETDPKLRIRQSISTEIPTVSVLDGILGAIAAIPGVARFRGYENDGDIADANSIPGGCISLVVDGGDEQAIANAIGVKKTPGCGTYGTTIETFTDAYGIPHAIGFFRPTEPPITWVVTLHALAGYTADIAASIQAALSNWTNNLGIGASILLTRAWVPANLCGGPNSSTFELVSITVARDGNAQAASDVTIAFNEAPFCTPSNITITVV